MLYEAAQVMLTRTNKWSWLKAWAMQIARRRGMKKAIVAQANRLADAAPTVGWVARVTMAVRVRAENDRRETRPANTSCRPRVSSRKLLSKSSAGTVGVDGCQTGRSLRVSGVKPFSFGSVNRASISARRSG